MKIKLGVLFLVAVIVIASAGMGISYANGGIELGQVPSCWCDVAFTSAEPGDPPDNEDDKDVGDVTVTLDPSGSSITIDVTTAYPGYEAYVDFTITNTGCKPIYLYGVNVNYDDSNAEDALDVSVDGLPTELPALLCSGDSWEDGTVTVKVTQDAEQNTVYGFTIEMNFEGCCSDPEIINGGFEQPVLPPQSWNIFASGTPSLGWTVDWHGGSTTYQGQTRPEPALLELHRHVSGWSPREGEQYAELDTDWDGPNGGLNGEPASVKISQVVVSCPWRTYTLAFSWSPRPGHADNGLKVYWDGAEIFDSGIVSGVGNGKTDWHIETITGLTVTGVSTSIEFVETGTPDSLGMFLDAVSVQLVID